MKLVCQSFRCALVDGPLQMELRSQQPHVQREWFPDWSHQKCDFESDANDLVAYYHQAHYVFPIGVAHSLLLQRQSRVVGSQIATYGLLGLVVRVERDPGYPVPLIQVLQTGDPYFCNQ